MKLYYMPGSCALAPHIVLEWSGDSFEAVRLDHEEIHQPAYLQIHPLGKVPALVEDYGKVMTQDGAILLYLADKYPEINLGAGQTLHERYEMMRWICFLTGDLHPAFVPLFVPQRFLPDKNNYAEVRKMAKTEVRRYLHYADGELNGRDHVIADRRTILDPYLFVFTHWARKFFGSLDEFPNLKSFYEHLTNDEGVRKAFAAQGIE